MSVVLLNVFIAILCDAYNKAKFVEEKDDGGYDARTKNFLDTIKENVKDFINNIRLAFWAYFGLGEELEAYYVRKVAGDDEPISKSNFIFDYGLLFDWELGNNAVTVKNFFNVHTLWGCVRNSKKELSKFVKKKDVCLFH